MCDPVSMLIGSAAMSAGSIFANQAGEAERNSARDGAVAGEARRAAGIESQASNLFQKTLGTVDKTKTDAEVKAEADKRTAEDSALIDSAGNFTPPTGSAPTEVGQAIARAGQAAVDRGKHQARLNANVSAVGGVRQKQGIEIGRDGAWQDIFGKRLQRSAGILPLELEEANRAGSTARGIGSLLSAGASVAGAAGMSGGAGGWSNPFSGGAENISGFAKGAGPIGPSGGAMANQPGFFARLWR